MKKYVLIALLALTTCITFGNTATIKVAPEWDRPLYQQKVSAPRLTPTIQHLSLEVQGANSDNLNIWVYFSSYADMGGHAWRVTIPTQVYMFIGAFPRHWQWVTMLYTIDVDACCIEAHENITIAFSGKLILQNGNLGGSGYVRDDQYYVSAITQL